MSVLDSDIEKHLNEVTKHTKTCQDFVEMFHSANRRMVEMISKGNGSSFCMVMNSKTKDVFNTVSKHNG